MWFLFYNIMLSKIPDRFKYLSDNGELDWVPGGSGRGSCVAVQAVYEGRELKDRGQTADCDWTGQVICQEQ